MKNNWDKFQTNRNKIYRRKDDVKDLIKDLKEYVV